jgi:hypothetical protein
LEKWTPLADAAIDQYCAGLDSDGAEAAAKAKNASAKFRSDLGLG